jgi:hypothetical protein
MQCCSVQLWELRLYQRQGISYAVGILDLQCVPPKGCLTCCWFESHTSTKMTEHDLWKKKHIDLFFQHSSQLATNQNANYPYCFLSNPKPWLFVQLRFKTPKRRNLQKWQQQNFLSLFILNKKRYLILWRRKKSKKSLWKVLSCLTCVIQNYILLTNNIHISTVLTAIYKEIKEIVALSSSNNNKNRIAWALKGSQ